MRYGRYAALAAFLAAYLCVHPAGAQSREADEAMLRTLQQTGAIRSGLEVNEARKTMLRLFVKTDIDGGGVSESDYALEERIADIRDRTGPLFLWLLADFDADGNTTKAELETYYGWSSRQDSAGLIRGTIPTDEEISQFIQKHVEEALRADSNGDGVVTFVEALNFAPKLARPRPERAPRRPIPLSLDANGDGIVSKNELLQALDRLLAEIDADHDGIFSEPELTASMARFGIPYALSPQEEERRRTEAKKREQDTRCALPKVPAGAKVALVGSYEGLAYSSASIGSVDEPILVSDIRIEPGKDPLYVVLASYRPTIWRFSGEVSRVAMAVASAHVVGAKDIPRVGIVGLSPQTVHLLPDRRCLSYFSKVNSKEADATAEQLHLLLGKRSDFMVADHALGRIHLPSGKIDPIAVFPDAFKGPTGGPAEIVWREAMRRCKAGLVRIDPASVVSTLPVAALEVYPETFGLAQLLEAGALRVTATQKVTQIGNLTIVGGGGNMTLVGPPGNKVELVELPSEFTIVRKIRMPPGLNSGIYQFRLAPGVPEPDGITNRVRLVR